MQLFDQNLFIGTQLGAHDEMSPAMQKWGARFAQRFSRNWAMDRELLFSDRMYWLAYVCFIWGC